MVNQQDPGTAGAVSRGRDGMSVNGTVTDRQPHPTDPNRWADGTVRPGNQTARKHGVYAAATERGEVPEDLRLTVDQFREGLISDRGGREALTTLEAAYVMRVVDLEMCLRLLQSDIVRRGLHTPKGRVRASYSKLLETMDRFDKFAQRLGLERKARQVDPLEALRRAVDDVNRQ